MFSPMKPYIFPILASQKFTIEQNEYTETKRYIIKTLHATVTYTDLDLSTKVEIPQKSLKV